MTHVVAPEGKGGCSSPFGVRGVGRSEPALLGAQAHGTGFNWDASRWAVQKQGAGGGSRHEGPVCSGVAALGRRGGKTSFQILGVFSTFLSQELILPPTAIPKAQ